MAHFVAFCIGFQKNIPLQNPPGGEGGIWQLKVYLKECALALSALNIYFQGKAEVNDFAVLVFVLLDR